jgi:peptidoglycan/xylan/chitin deacetylase (PgdA/CDA1 family)
MFSREKQTLTRAFRIALLIPGMLLYSGIRFSEPDLSSGNLVLTTAEIETTGGQSFTVLLNGKIGDNTVRPITWYPEEWSWFGDTGTLQIRNRLGLFRTSGNMTQLVSLAGFSGFGRGGPIRAGKLLPVAASPDGRYLAWFKPLSAAFGSIIITDTETAVRQTIAEKAEMNLRAGPVVWSPDSSLFVWEEQGYLRFRAADPTGKRGSLGEGSIEGAGFSSSGEFYYLSGKDLHIIKTDDFALRDLYRDLPLVTQPLTTLPLGFDPDLDRWWLSPDGSKILLYKGDGGVFLLPVNDRQGGDDLKSIPSLSVGSRFTIRQVLFTGQGGLLILLGQITGTGRDTRLAEWQKGDSSFRFRDDRGLIGMVASPDGRQTAFFEAGRVSVKSANGSGVLERFVPDLIGGVFSGNEKLVLLTKREALQLDTGTGQVDFLFLTQPGSVSGFNTGNRIQTLFGDTAYSWNADTGTWSAGGDALVREKKTWNEEYRIFLEPLVDHPWESRLMVRKVGAGQYGTEPLFAVPEGKYQPFPESGEDGIGYGGIYFRHGSRIRRREVSLVFNVENDVSGLPSMLETLNDYSIKCTFFVSGDVIRRFPESVKSISDAGHETGSLFYTGLDLSDNRYVSDTRFIIQGLADNEDRFFELTGRELAPLWHAPWYIVNRNVLNATREMNYTCVGRDITGEPSASPELRTEWILARTKPGSIIPVPVMHPRGGSETAVPHLEFLIQGLLEEGYQPVPVTVLMAHAK